MVDNSKFLSLSQQLSFPAGESPWPIGSNRGLDQLVAKLKVQRQLLARQAHLTLKPLVIRDYSLTERKKREEQFLRWVNRVNWLYPIDRAILTHCNYQAKFLFQSSISQLRQKIIDYISQELLNKILDQTEIQPDLLTQLGFANSDCSLTVIFNYYYQLCHRLEFIPLLDQELLKAILLASGDYSCFVKSAKIVSERLEGPISIKQLLTIYRQNNLNQSRIQLLAHLYQTGIYDFHLTMPKSRAPNFTWPILPVDLLPLNIFPNRAQPVGLIKFKELPNQVKSYFYGLITDTYQIPFEVRLYNYGNIQILSADDNLVNNFIKRPKSWLQPQIKPGLNIIPGWHDVISYLPLEAVKLLYSDVQHFVNLETKQSTDNLTEVKSDISTFFLAYLNLQQANLQKFTISNLLNSTLSFNLTSLWWQAGYFKLNLLNLPHCLVSSSRNDSAASLILALFLRSLLALFLIQKQTNNNQSYLKQWTESSYQRLPRIAKIALAQIFTLGDKRIYFYSDQTINSCLTDSQFKAPFTLNQAIIKYNHYRSYSSLIQWLLLNLYQTKLGSDVSLMLIANLLDKERSRLEDLILKYCTNTVDQQIASKIGLYIAPHLEEVEQYIINNLLAYQLVVDRPAGLDLPSLDKPSTLVPAYLAQFGDLEIMLSLGCFFPFTSRLNLLEQIMDLLIKPNFFRPICPPHPLAQYRNSALNPQSVNSQTTLLTEINNQSMFIIGYGTLLRYRAYELEELNHSFQLNIETKSDNSAESSTLIFDFLSRSPRIVPIFNPQTSYQLASLSNTLNIEIYSNDQRLIQPTITPILSSMTIGDSNLTTNSNQIGYGARLINSFVSSLTDLLFDSAEIDERPNINSDDLICYSPEPEPEDLLSLSLSPISHFDQDNLINQLKTAPKIPLIFPNFRRPETPELEFSISEITGLRQLLDAFFQTVSLTEQDNKLMAELLSKIQIGQEIKRELDLEEDNYRLQFSRLAPSTKTKISQWLKLLFETGMYMRRWAGPGQAYPLLESETLPQPNPNSRDLSAHNIENEEFKHERKISENIGLLYSLLIPEESECQTYLFNLIAYNLVQGQLQRLNRTLQQILITVGTLGAEDDQACIRINSTIFIGTSYFYLTFLTEQKITNFDPHRLEYIS